MRLLRLAFVSLICLLPLAIAAQTIKPAAGGAPVAGQSYTDAGFSMVPTAITEDSQGNFYVAYAGFQSGTAVFDYNAIFKTTPDGKTTLYAGGFGKGDTGDGGLATAATLDLTYATGIAVDASGNLYLPDYDNCVVREVDASTGDISTIAGIKGTCSYSGDGGAATSAGLNAPLSVLLESSGNLLIAAYGGDRVREISGRQISTYVGNGNASGTGAIDEVSGIAMDSSGNLYIASLDSTGYGLVYEVNTSKTITLLAGNTTGTVCAAHTSTVGDGCPPTQALLEGITGGIAVDASGNVYVSNWTTTFADIVEIEPGSPGVVVNFAGSEAAKDSADQPGDGGLPTSALLGGVDCIYVDANGDMYLADGPDYRVRKISGNVISTFAGNGLVNSSGDGGSPLLGQVSPVQVAVDGSGDLFVSDDNDNQIREITKPGTSNAKIKTIAGTGVSGYSGDGAQATAAKLSSPGGIAVDASGDVIFADQSGAVLRMINSSTGVISTIAGVAGAAGDSGDGGVPTSADIDATAGLAVDSTGNVYFTDPTKNVIREVTGIGGSGPLIQTISGVAGNSGGFTNGTAFAGADLAYLGGIAVDSSGNFYLRDNGYIAKVAKATGEMELIGASEISPAEGVAVDGRGDVFFLNNDGTMGVDEIQVGSGSTVELAGAGSQTSAQFTGSAADAALCS
ncbi:MAG: SBBP repeat-containing protein, partial [Terriglobales bacterium]